MVADHLPFHRAGQDSGDSVWGSGAGDLRLDAAGRGTADSAGMGCGRTGAGIEGGQHRRHTGEVFWFAVFRGRKGFQRVLTSGIAIIRTLLYEYTPTREQAITKRCACVRRQASNAERATPCVQTPGGLPIADQPTECGCHGQKGLMPDDSTLQAC